VDPVAVFVEPSHGGLALQRRAGLARRVGERGVELGPVHHRHQRAVGGRPGERPPAAQRERGPVDPLPHRNVEA
jgi:hypothetical protein